MQPCEALGQAKEHDAGASGSTGGEVAQAYPVPRVLLAIVEQKLRGGTMYHATSALPVTELFTPPQLGSETPDIAASAFRELGRAVVTLVWGFRPANYGGLRANSQRAIDTLVLTSIAGAFCTLAVGLFFGYFGLWLAVLVCGASVLQTLLALYLVRSGRARVAVWVLAVWAPVLVDIFLLTSGGPISSTAAWYAIIPCVVMVVMKPRYRLHAMAVVVLHQLLIISIIHAGWYTDVLLLSSTTSNVHFNFIASVLFSGAFGFGVSAAHRVMVSRVRHAERNTRVAMQYVVSGFLVVNRRGELVIDSSAGVESWLPGAVAGARLETILSRVQPAFAEEFRVRFDDLVENSLPLALCLEQLPNRITLNRRPHTLRYQALCTESGEWNRLVITLDDLTDELAQNKAAAERQTLAALIRCLQRDARHTEEWVSESRRRVRSLSTDLEAADWDDTLSELRTEASDAGFGALLHALEEAQTASQGGAREHAAMLVQAAWIKLQEQYDELVEEDRFLGVRVGGDEYAQLLRLIERKAPHDVLLNRARGWSAESTAAAVRTGEVVAIARLGESCDATSETAA